MESSDIMAFWSDGNGNIAPLIGGVSNTGSSAPTASGILSQLFVPILVVLTLLFIFSYIRDDADAMALEFAILIAVIIMIKAGY